MVTQQDIETAERIARVAEAKFASTEEVAALRRVIEASKTAETRVAEAFDALRPFAKVAEHWRAELYMRDDAECVIAWASDVAARLITCMASELPRIKFEAFRRAAMLTFHNRERAANTEAAAAALDAIRRAVGGKPDFDADDSGAREHVLDAA